MAATEPDQHEAEVARRERFEFGKNWARFLRVLNDERIALAERSLADMLEVSRLDGKTFLDIGSGSGLFSLAARRLGAKVHSFDYDPSSYACTLELRRRYFPDDPDWTVERGSVLDRDYLNTLGTFDVVYSWGVLHHTGQMRQALKNVKPLVRMNGHLFIAIYNDRGESTDEWEAIKKKFVSLSWPINIAYMVAHLARQELPILLEAIRTKKTRDWLRSWTSYDHISVRGMNRWHDLVDWYGGYPYERASVEDIADGFANDGFRLLKIVDVSHGTGCNEFVFVREAPLGTFVDSPIPGGLSFSRRYGCRILGPFRQHGKSWISDRAPFPEGAPLFLFRDDRLLGKAERLDEATVVASADEPRTAIESAILYAVAAERRPPPEEPFVNVGGHMWKWDVPDLAAWGDDMSPSGRTSPVFVFQDGVQLPWPHSIHDEIRTLGRGRFSHWGTSVYFSSLDNSDPNVGKERFCLMIAANVVKPLG